MIIDAQGFCGIGYGGPKKESMFSVTSWSCATGYYSFAHEVAHNMVREKANTMIFWLRACLLVLLMTLHFVAPVVRIG